MYGKFHEAKYNLKKNSEEKQLGKRICKKKSSEKMFDGQVYFYVTVYGGTIFCSPLDVNF